MGGIGVIDRFLEVFTRYIDSGFGLLGGEVTFLSSTLIVIDITLAGLFWAFAANEDIIARLVRKTLYIGVFAFLIGNFNGLARIVFESFASLGLKASGSAVDQAEFLQPGRLARVGLEAGRPILAAAGELMGFVSFFDNFIQIFVLLIAWLVVLVAFFLLAVQLFVTLIEFKITTLAGFVLLPFGLFGKTAFLAEKVLGNVVASGVKVLVLAVIVGIGTGLFGEFTRGFGAVQPTLEDALALVLAALSLLGLGLFGPGIATGLVSGAPQLGAGAAAGTSLAAGGLAVAGGMAATGAVTAAARLGAAGGRFTGGLAVAREAARRTDLAREIGALGDGGGGPGSSRGKGPVPQPPVSTSPSDPPGKAPAWAQRLRHSEAARHGAAVAMHTIRSSDAGGVTAAVPLDEEDRR